MKKLLALLFLLAAPALGNPTYILLRYDYGNQITRSGLVILSNGLVMHSQTNHGRTTYFPDKQLTPESLERLTHDIEKSALAGPPVHKEGHPTAMGSSSGNLIASTKSGYLTYIFGITRGSSPTSKDFVVHQPGPEAKIIIEYVNAEVRDKMPIDLISECNDVL